MNKSNLWVGDSVSLCLKNWFIRDDTKLIKSLPILVLWFIWLTRNKCYFKDLIPSSLQVAALSLGMLSSFPQHMRVVSIRSIVAEEIDKSYPWGYFDGSTTGEPKLCGVGGLIYITDQHFFSYKAGLGSGSNNFAELLGLKLLLSLSLDNNLKKLQIFGDSQLVINWATGKYRIQNVKLAQILMEVHRLVDMFDSMSFVHIYCERNTYADILAKKSANVMFGSWQISEQREVECFETVKLF